MTELKQSLQFILRADSTTGAPKLNRSASKNAKALWDAKKLQVGDYFSSVSYLRVDKIDGNTITVANALGGSWVMSKDLLVRDAWSADHFNKEVPTKMTDLAAILVQCRDTIFTVSFKKKVD